MRTSLLAAAVLAGAGPGPAAELTGTVRAAGGGPVAGATVFVRTAAPRAGVGVL